MIPPLVSDGFIIQIYFWLVKENTAVLLYFSYIVCAAFMKKRCRPIGLHRKLYYTVGLKLSFRLTERLKTRWSSEESLLSLQK